MKPVVFLSLNTIINNTTFFYQAIRLNLPTLSNCYSSFWSTLWYGYCYFWPRLWNCYSVFWSTLSNRNFLFGQHNEIGKLLKLNSFTVIVKSVHSARCSRTLGGLLASTHFMFIFCMIWLGWGESFENFEQTLPEKKSLS